MRHRRMLPPVTRDPNPPATSLRTLALLFLRLGATAFGGPAAHVALMHREVVRKRGWLDDAAFLDLVAATNLIPGPNSTELAIHIGWRRRGWAGLCVAGLAFIVPAVLITTLVAWAYVRFGRLPEVARVLYGIKPVMISVVAVAIVRLARSALRTPRAALLAGLALVLLWLGVDELAVLFAIAALALVTQRRAPLPLACLAVPSAPSLLGSSLAAAISPPALFAIFLKIGSVLFGSGYVLLAFLRAELVEQRGWLTEPQLIDAVAAGQITPGPVFSTATFIGYLLAGTPGAFAATAGVFLPAFVFVALSSPLLPRLRASAPASAFLDGLNVASLALMLVVAFQLGRAALVDLPTCALALASLAGLLVWDVSSLWLILMGAVVGLSTMR